MIAILCFTDWMHSFWIAGGVILFIYTLMMLFVLTGVLALPETRLIPDSPLTRFSVIIAFKDEETNLPNLLQSLKELTYPAGLFEIILVDDHSTDASAEITRQYDFVRYIPAQGKGKKQALSTGIQAAKYEWIVTTDADCTVPPDWLRYFDSAIRQKKPKMLLGAVRLAPYKFFWSRFQQFEFLSLQAITIAGVYFKHPFLANGANLAFEKQAFFAVNGYTGNRQIASGDDVFLLEKFQAEFPGKIFFVKNKNAIVQTLPQPDVHSMIQQKIRWAGKTKHLHANLPKLVGIITILSNLILITAWFNFNYSIVLRIYILSKFILDSSLVYSMHKIYRVPFDTGAWLLSFVLYPFYLGYLGFQSLRRGYVWKGRVYRK